MLRIAVAYILAVLVMLVVVRAMVRRRQVQYIPTPHGPMPVPTDAELRAAWTEHPPDHGYQRADGMRYCTDCGWTPALGWLSREVAPWIPDPEGSGEVVEGHKVTMFIHNCPVEE